MSFDLEKRTLDFAIAIRDLFKEIKHGLSNGVYIKQLIRSGSSGQLIEVNEDRGEKI